MLEDESQLPPQQGPTRMQIFVANKLTTIFSLLHNRVVKEQKMACPSNTPYAILKDGIVLLEHDACQEQPLDLLGTFNKRNSAMGTPNLSGFYYRMTDFVASQLYHLSDIIKANSAIRGSNLHRHSICQRMENQDQILEKYIQNKYVHFECQVQSG